MSISCFSCKTPSGKRAVTLPLLSVYFREKRGQPDNNTQTDKSPDWSPNAEEVKCASRNYVTDISKHLEKIRKSKGKEAAQNPPLYQRLKIYW